MGRGYIAEITRCPSLKTVLAVALALQIPSYASACRIGWDQHIFEQSPAPNVLPGAQIIRVHFSNARPGIDRWSGSISNYDGGSFDSTLIGVARIIGAGSRRRRAIPGLRFRDIV